MKKIYILLAILSIMFLTGCKPGTLDATFGTGGIVTTDMGGGDNASALVIQPDGKIVAAGYSLSGSSYDFTLVRYNANGGLDTNFGTGGIVTTAIGSNGSSVQALVIQSDNKIVAAGRTDNISSSDFALVRYNANGNLDTTFGKGGIVITAIGSSGFAQALVIQPDGKIVAAGSSGSSSDFTLVRYNPDGTLDATFGTGGKVTTAIGSGGWAQALGIQSDDKIVAAGYSVNAGINDFTLVRYNPNGSLDHNFGTGGKVITPIGSDSSASALVIQPDGLIVAAGYSVNGSNNSFALVRYNANGSLDQNFGTGGKVTTAIGSHSDSASALVIQSGGKIVAAGGTFNGSIYNFALVRYNANGSLDTTFGKGGIVITAIGNDNYARALGIQSDGKIVAAGLTFNGSNYDFALARYWP